MTHDAAAWADATYHGDALTDALLALDMATVWSEKGRMVIGDELIDWSLGVDGASWTAETHPSLGCNGDAASMSPKGVVGVRLDGADNVEFVGGLDIYQLTEHGATGSELCGAYWDGDFSALAGGGHYYQTAPLQLGYSGNMAHGVMADWSTLAFAEEGGNEVNIHHIYSHTGLVRAVGLYTQSELIFPQVDDEAVDGAHDDVTLSPTKAAETPSPTEDDTDTPSPIESSDVDLGYVAYEGEHIRGEDRDVDVEDDKEVTGEEDIEWLMMMRGKLGMERLNRPRAKRAGMHPSKLLSWKSGKHKKKKRDLPQLPEDEQTLYGVPNYARLGYQGVDEAVLYADAIKDGESLPVPEPKEEKQAKKQEPVDGVWLNFAYLVAGQTLYEDNTSTWTAPYQPAVAKAYHSVESNEGRVVSRPRVTTVRCIFGRDGVDSDFGFDEGVDNSECFGFEDDANSASSNDKDTITNVYSSCGYIDGLFYLKPSADLGILPAICSHGYAMLDGFLDRNLQSLPQFLSSYDYERYSTDHLIPNLDDFASFRQWLLPSDNSTTFRVAADCSECIDGEFGENTAYHISSHAFCGANLLSSGCPAYFESCSQCDAVVQVADEIDDDDWIRCNALHLSADYEPSHDHSTCVSHGLSFRPTISNIRDGCTCFRARDERKEYGVALSQLPLITSTADVLLNALGIPFIADNIQFDPDWFEAAQPTEDARESNVVRLRQNDFLDGTYRIVKSGTYVITEDIAFDFNGPSALEMAQDFFSPNSIDGDELHWFPTHSQAVRDGDYPGLFNYEGAFSLGFFAGITVEADFVTIDLNGHQLAQSERFYFQQRFFALIELGSRQFLPGQGPSNWGVVDEMYPSNVEVKDGVLGRSSHHGIHGLNNGNVLISNVTIAHFDIAGLQCNGCHDVVVRDCVAGPQNRDIPVLGRYTHARALLPRLKQLVEEHGEEEIAFFDRETVTVSELVERLTDQMDMVYLAHFEGVHFPEDDEEWVATQKLFVNPSGWNDGGSSYGIAFGGQGAQVLLSI